MNPRLEDCDICECYIFPNKKNIISFSRFILEYAEYMDHPGVVCDVVDDIFGPVAFEGEARDSLLLWLQREYSKMMRREASHRRGEGKPGAPSPTEGATTCEKRPRASSPGSADAVGKSNFRWGDES